MDMQCNAVIWVDVEQRSDTLKRMLRALWSRVKKCRRAQEEEKMSQRQQITDAAQQEARKFVHHKRRMCQGVSDKMNNLIGKINRVAQGAPDMEEYEYVEDLYDEEGMPLESDDAMSD